jgi:hypothetical protein
LSENFGFLKLYFREPLNVMYMEGGGALLQVPKPRPAEPAMEF